MATEDSTGTLSISGSTETDLSAAATTAGVFEAHIDLTNLAAGQILTVRAYSKITSGGSLVQADEWQIGPVPPSEVHWISPPLASVHQWKFTAEYDGSSATSFAWSIVQIDG